MDDRTSTLRVHGALRRAHGVPVARGELTIDPGFARDFLNWRRPGAGGEALSDVDRLAACCRELALDLVCLPLPAWDDRTLAAFSADAGRLAVAGLFVFAVVDGAFQSALTEIGMIDLMTEVGRSPEDAGRELRRRSRRVTAAVARGAEAGAHGIIVADDIACGRGPLVAPVFVERFLRPLWEEQVRAAHEVGLPVLLHSDGNLTAVLEQVAAAGFDGVQCIEAAAGMDPHAVQARWGDRLCLMGTIDPALLVDPAASRGGGSSVDALEATVAETMACAAEGGGIIFGTCSGLYAGLSPARVERMYRLARDLDPFRSAA